MLRLTGNPAKIPRKVVARIECFIEEDKTFGLRISGYRANEIQVDFTEEHKIFGIGSHRSILKSTLHHMKIRVHRKELPIQMCELQERSLCGPKIGSIEHKKKLCNKNDAPAEKHGIGRNMSISSMTATRPRSTRVLKFGHYQHLLRRNPRKEHLWQMREHQCTCWAGKIWVQPNCRLFGHPETPQRLSQPMEKCKHMRKPQYTFTTLSSSWRCKSSKDTPLVLTSVKNPQLTKNGKIILCNSENFVLIVVPGSTGSSSSRTSSTSTSLPQDTSGGISPSPAIQRSDDTHAQASRNRGGPTKTKKQNQKQGQQSSIEYLIVRSPRLVKRSSQKILRTKKCQH